MGCAHCKGEGWINVGGDGRPPETRMCGSCRGKGKRCGIKGCACKRKGKGAK
jgi:hypothetical protein